MDDAESELTELSEVTTDKPIEHEECIFCNEIELECLHANASNCADQPMKRLMARELVFHGILSDDAIYRQMCNDYNDKIHSKMVSSGIKSTKWTPKLLEKHFDKHVQLVPRRILAKQIQMLNTLSKLNFDQAIDQAEQASDDPLDIKCARACVPL